jgi:hypothetical protein
MIGLALLGLAMTVLIKSTAGNIFNARQAQMMGVVTELARGKMYELEETLLKDGFTDTGLANADDCTDYKGFEDEGWPSVQWCAKIEQVELPSWDVLQAMAAGAGSGSGSKPGSGAGAGSGEMGGGFQDSGLNAMLAMLGGGFGGGGASSMAMDSKAGASFIQGQYQMIQEIMKVSIRKVTLDVKWQVVGSERDLRVVAFFTDSAAMDKVLSGLGSQELPGASAEGGASGGSGTGKGKGGTGTPTGTTRSGSGTK